MSPKVGFACVPYLPPEQFRGIALAAESSGLDELWMWEDCFKQSGVATAAAALAWTSRIRVGIGLLPAPLRNVAVTAMEIATLERMFPGRLIPGVGHGVQSWMDQAGARVASPLTLLREYVDALHQLLRGEEVSVAGRYVHLDRIILDWPPASVPALGVGGGGPKSVALAAELGDIFLLSAAMSDAEIAAAHRMVSATRTRLRPTAGSAEIVATQIVATGAGARERVDAEMTHWRDEVGPGVGSAGDAVSIAADFRRLGELGVTSIAVQPTRDEPDLPGLIEFIGREVRPLLA